MSKQLLQRNTKILLVWLPLILVVCSVIFYILMRMQAHHMQQKQLLLKQQNVWSTFIAKQGNIERRIIGEYEIKEGDNGIQPLGNELSDTTLSYAAENKSLPFQVLTKQFSWNGQHFQLTTFVSSEEISHLIIKVFLIEIVILCLLLLAIVFFNNKSSGTLWQPFFSTIKKVNAYDITRGQQLSLPQDTGTTEFDELNKVVNDLVANVNTAYLHQKQFVENASHEMQTPLAIIRSKLELLINQPDITEKAALLLADITEANDRLSLMNRTLLLLAKIENNQFPETGPINVTVLLQNVVNNFEQYYDEFPKVEQDIKENIIVNANRSLIEILVSNLVKNAIEHNIPNGNISLQLSITQLIIKNTGSPLQVNGEELFERFKKGSHQTKTTGLGLALVKQICSLYGYGLAYEYAEGWHTLMITFV
jgi:signal transduction histidine kinase